MIVVDGTPYKTIEDAARDLKVHPKTLRSYIERKIVSEPPFVPNGLVDRKYFPDELIERYRTEIESYKLAKKGK